VPISLRATSSGHLRAGIDRQRPDLFDASSGGVSHLQVPTAVEREDMVQHRDDDNDSGEIAVEITSAFDADFLEQDDDSSTSAAAQTGADLPRGAAMLVVTRGPSAGSRFLLDRLVTTAGRHPDSDILLDDVTVSRRHVEFRLDKDGNWTVVDVGSLNGTYVNRQPVDSPVVLANNDALQIGKFRLTFLA
jgi:pSer/pThr/pTyr-binding forkhead associated (FHA) protein